MAKFTTKQRIELMGLLDRAMQPRTEQEQTRAATVGAFRPAVSDRPAEEVEWQTGMSGEINSNALEPETSTNVLVAVHALANNR